MVRYDVYDFEEEGRKYTAMELVCMDDEYEGEADITIDQEDKARGIIGMNDSSNSNNCNTNNSSTSSSNHHNNGYNLHQQHHVRDLPPTHTTHLSPLVRS